MTNSITNLAPGWPHTDSTHDSIAKNNPAGGKQGFLQIQDAVTLNNHKEIATTYSSALTIPTESEQDQYTLLRGLVTNMLKEQGIDFKVASGALEIDLGAISQEEASELISDDGYFGVEQTSNRIVDFAVGIAGGDPSRLDAIKEGVEKGFNEALDTFGGWLPEVSHDTYDMVMNKLDTWADIESSQQAS